MVRVFTSNAIRKQLTESELTDLIRDFKGYKEKGEFIATFGRDVAYDHPNTPPLIRHERVFHIHLLPIDKIWPKFITQYQKTSDTHLVYCQGSLNEMCFLLISILEPDAHELTTQNNVMRIIGTMAERFRLKY